MKVTTTANSLLNKSDIKLLAANTTFLATKVAASYIPYAPVRFALELLGRSWQMMNAQSAIPLHSKAKRVLDSPTYRKLLSVSMQVSIASAIVFFGIDYFKLAAVHGIVGRSLAFTKQATHLIGASSAVVSLLGTAQSSVPKLARSAANIFHRPLDAIKASAVHLFNLGVQWNLTASRITR